MVKRYVPGVKRGGSSLRLRGTSQDVGEGCDVVQTTATILLVASRETTTHTRVHTLPIYAYYYYYYAYYAYYYYYYCYCYCYCYYYYYYYC